MDVSYLSLIMFIIITILYFSIPTIGKPLLTVEILNEPDGLTDYYSLTMSRLALYILAIIVSQLFLNSSYLITKCGGDVSKNIGAAALFTFIPWVLIFGVLVAVLLMFPAFKNAFSDVIGYFVVSSSANNILSSILIGTDLNKLIDQTQDQTKKTELTYAAEAIMKICGNKSILINQMNPENFTTIWETLKPLMIQGAYEDIGKKQALLDLVVLKDNIGEAFWYTYTAILISSIVYYNLATRGCVKDINTIKADHDQYIQEQEAAQKQSELNNTTTYTM